MPLFIRNIFKCKFKSCLRSSLHFLWKKFILNINLELILHNISGGVKRIPPNVQRNISNIGIQFTIQLNVSLVFMVFMFFTCSKKFMFSTTYAFLSHYHKYIMHNRMNCCIVFWDVPQFYKKDYLFFDSIPIQKRVSQIQRLCEPQYTSYCHNYILL